MMSKHTAGYSCGCLVSVYVCEGCLGVADEYLSIRVKELTDQLQLGILDSEVSVSDTGDGRHG